MSQAEAVFVMPHYSDDPLAERHLDRALAGLAEQTDPDWRLVIVDDASPDPQVLDRLRRRVAGTNGRAVLLAQPANQGQGVCRNIGVAWAAAHGAPFVLFNDADDVSHPRRLEVTRRVFARHPEVGFVYSTFHVVDEADRPVQRESLAASVVEILDSHRVPVEGRHGWIRIGVETGYTSLTSTVAVRTGIALDHPFPPRGSEDAHTWLRISAVTEMRYEASIPSRYRIAQHVTGSADRTRMGKEFYRRKAELDLEGFLMAASSAVAQGAIRPADVPDLRRRFLRRLAETLCGDQQHDLADSLLAEEEIQA
jgi:glycosyltransferase involved in cell wall biosynthesis